METEKIYICSVEDTKKYGIICASIIGRVRMWCEYNEKNKVKDRFHNGEWWSGFMSAREFSEQIGISQRTVEKNLSKLVDNNVLIKDSFNKKGFDRTGWYRVNPNTPIEYPIYPDRVDDIPLESKCIYPNSVVPNTLTDETIPVKHSVNHNVKQPVNTTVNPSVNPVVELTNFDKEQLLSLLNNINAPHNILGYVRMLIEDGPSVLTPRSKQLVLDNKQYFNRGTLLPKVINQLT
jgi:hypothetical protein